LPQGAAILKQSVPDWVKPSCVIFDTGHSKAQPLASECPDVKITNDGLVRSGTGCL